MAGAKELLSEITDHIENIHRLLLLFEPTDAEQFNAINELQETLTLWETNQLHELRGVFEG